MKMLRYITFACIFLSHAHAFAQSPSDPLAEPALPPSATSVQLNQPYASDHLGNVVLPFMWNISEEKNHIVATENSELDPAVITVDSVKFPADLKADNVVHNILKSLAQALNTALPQDKIAPPSLCPENPDAKKCKNPLLHYAVSLQGTENDIPRTCAFDLYASQAAASVIALSFCAPKDKLYDPQPAAILQQIFSSFE